MLRLAECAQEPTLRQEMLEEDSDSRLSYEWELAELGNRS